MNFQYHQKFNKKFTSDSVIIFEHVGPAVSSLTFMQDAFLLLIIAS